jgi:putative heme-binding domain-containing protein
VPNVIGFQGILRYKLHDQGASFGAVEQDPILSSSDPNFRPTDCRIGPDGALYFIDWHNPIIGHMQHNLRDPSRDRVHGRIYRVTHEGFPLSPSPKIAGEPIATLLDRLKEPEDRVRYRTRLELTGRPSGEVLDGVKTWIAHLNPKDAEYEHHLLEALWLHQSHDVVNEELLRRELRSPDFHARAAATRVLCYWRDRVRNPLELLRTQVTDAHPRVRLEAIRALSFFHGEEAVAVAVELLGQPTDEYLAFTFNETITTLERRLGGKVNRNNLAGSFVAMLDKPGVTPERRATLLETIMRHGGGKELEAVWAEVLKKDNLSSTVRRRTIEGLADAALTRKAQPKVNPSTIRPFLSDADPGLQADVIHLVAAWRVKGLADDIRRLAQDARTPVDSRYAAVEALGALADDESLKTLLALTGPSGDAALRFRASAALSRVNTKAGAEAAARALADAKQSDDPAPVVEALLQRKQGSDLLAAALDSHALSPDTAKRVLRAMYLAGRNDPKLNAVISKYAGLDATLKLPTSEEIRKLGDEATAQGDPVRGERVFRRAELGCINCHAINKAGGSIGPDLGPVGGSSPMDYIVQSILDPNASVKEEYLTKTIITAAGQAITGIVVEKTRQSVTLKDATGKKIKIAAADIEEETKGKTLMPEGVTRILPRSDLLDLIRFVSDLGKPGPYAIPKAVTMQRWKRLKSVPVALKDTVPTRDGLRDHVHGAAADAFDPVYALVNGNVPLDEMRKPGMPPQVNYLVSELEVTTAGALEFVVTGPPDTAFWINEAPFDHPQTARVRMMIGRNKVTVRAVAPDGTPAAVRVEIRKPNGSAIQYELVQASE